MSDDEPSTRVTLRDVYDVASDVKTTVIRMEGQVGSLLADRDDHEVRIRALEKRVWTAAGIALAGGAGLGQVLAVVGKVLAS
jgi:hypothetical protein